MNANQEIIAELRRVLGERDEAREQLDLTKRELGRWVDREAKALRERDSYQRQLDAIGDAIVTSITKRIEPRISRHPVTVVMAAGSLIAKIGEAIGCEFEDGDDLLEAVKELVRERDEARAEVERLRSVLSATSQELADIAATPAEERALALEMELAVARAERDEARAELSKLREQYDSVLEANVSLLDGSPYVDARVAFRRGAEAMREACAAALMADGLVLSRERAAKVVRARPIPEEP